MRNWQGGFHVKNIDARNIPDKLRRVDFPSAIISNPPRKVPLSTRLVVLFGGMFARLGWMFGGFGMVFVFVFAGNADYSSLLSFRAKMENASGVVTRIEKTSASEGGRTIITKTTTTKEEGIPVFAYHYKFSVGGKDYEGLSYFTGTREPSGATVIVEFPPGKPEGSRIRGMRRKLFGLGAVFVFLFPAIGFGVILVSLMRGWKNIRLLVDGETALGRLISKEDTESKMGNKVIYKITFEFTDLNGELRKTVAKTENPARLEDEIFERLFYDSKSPDRSVLLNSLSGNQSLNEHGELKPCSVSALWGVLWPPGVAALFVAAGLLIKAYI
ncbi:MAG: hypothetical protein WCS42_19330 [Verrucomicrobiota bacterium]